jgi:hypothetical protein
MAALSDGTSVIAQNSAAATTHTFSGKLTAGVDRFGRVSASVGGTGWDGLVSIKWNGVDMSEIGTGVSNGGRSTKMFGIVNPPTSGSDIVIEFSAPTAVGVVISSYNGVHQTTPTENTNTATGTGTESSVTITSAAGNLVVDAVTATAADVTPDGSQTQEGADVTDGGSYTMGASYEAGAASVAMTWTMASVSWGAIATSLRASGGEGQTPFASALSAPRFPRWMARLRG